MFIPSDRQSVSMDNLLQLLQAYVGNMLDSNRSNIKNVLDEKLCSQAQ